MGTHCDRDHAPETLYHADSVKGRISRTHTLVRSAVGRSMAIGSFPILEVFKDQLGVKGCMYKDFHFT